MFKIINIIEDKIILSTTIISEFKEFVNKIFVENGDNFYMQKPKTVLGCKNYIEEYCDNLIIEIK